MEYTIQKLAQLSGVSVRTLRYYDEIGLLVPNIQMANGRHLYGINELFYLTQILLLKQLGFKLEKIQSILDEGDSYKVCALIVQKKILLKEQERLQANLQVINSMITYYKEGYKMDQENIQCSLENFKNKKEYAKYFDEAYLEEKKKESETNLLSKAGAEYYEKYKEKLLQFNDLENSRNYGFQCGLILNTMNKHLTNCLKEESKEVQKTMKEQWDVLQMVYPTTHSKKVYFAIRDQVCSISPELKEKSTLALVDFLYKSMTIFGMNHFSED